MKPLLLAPFSNSDIRDWPIRHWSAMIDHLLPVWPGQVHVLGARSQRLRANTIVRSFNSTRVVNRCGKVANDALEAVVAGAACVIGNNSGLAHMAGRLGVPTLCIFGGAHQRREWYPQGPQTVTVSRAIGCSPCHLHHAADCPYDLACLRDISAAEVAALAVRLAAEADGETGVVHVH
jgi:ADP-heptose:LPS heptosyltransferase